MKKEQKRNPWLAALFLAYCGFMLYMLFIRNRSAIEGLPYWEQVCNNYNLKWFRTVENYWDVLTRPTYYIDKWGGYEVYCVQVRIAVINLAGNIATFIPFGAFLPAMWPKLCRFWKAVPLGVAAVIVVEILQLFSLRGKCDVDDLLLNTVGILIGYGLWRMVQSIRKRKGRR